MFRRPTPQFGEECDGGVMKCVICKDFETHHGNTLFTLKKPEFLLFVENVPAQICTNCGEEYFDEDTTMHLRKIASAAAKTGAQVEVRQYREA
jgi:YgiT-type zinc finger domain-containing protein